MALLASVVLLLSGCTKDAEEYSLNLEVWGAFDDIDAYRTDFTKYTEINPFVGRIDYRKFVEDEYKSELIDALASGNPPDVFLIHNTWLPQFQDKIASAPAGILGEAEFRANFPDTAISDAVRDGQVYAVPLSIDSLALYYNKDLFNFASITSPPTTWEEFNEDARRLTTVGTGNQVLQAGAAIGTSENINRSTDVVQALLFQAGINVGTDARNVSFTKNVANVLDYYTQFARVGSSAYCWNKRLHYSIDAFSEGTVGMMMNYSWQYDRIKRKNPNLNMAVAPLPQPSNGIKANYANYWMLAVAKSKFDTESADPQKKNEVRIHEAWEFLRYLSMGNNGKITLTNGLTGNTKEFSISIDPALTYLEKTGKPAARRDLIEKQKSDPFLGPFVTGNLLAKSWEQPDSEAVETVIADAVDGINIGQLDSKSAAELIDKRIRALSR